MDITNVHWLPWLEKHVSKVRIVFGWSRYRNFVAICFIAQYFADANSIRSTKTFNENLQKHKRIYSLQFLFEFALSHSANDRTSLFLQTTYISLYFLLSGSQKCTNFLHQKVYSETCQASVMDCSVKIINRFHSLIVFTKRCVLDL